MIRFSLQLTWDLTLNLLFFCNVIGTFLTKIDLLFKNVLSLNYEMGLKLSGLCPFGLWTLKTSNRFLNVLFGCTMFQNLIKVYKFLNFQVLSRSISYKIKFYVF